jgi:hypothetical protein
MEEEVWEFNHGIYGIGMVHGSATTAWQAYSSTSAACFIMAKTNGGLAKLQVDATSARWCLCDHTENFMLAGTYWKEGNWSIIERGSDCTS